MKKLKHDLLFYMLPVFLPAVAVGWWLAGSLWVFLAALAAGIVANLAGYWQGINKGSQIAGEVWGREFGNLRSGGREGK